MTTLELEQAQLQAERNHIKAGLDRRDLKYLKVNPDALYPRRSQTVRGRSID